MSFKKKHIPWNKGTKGLVFPNSGSFTSEKSKGSLNVEWKGNDVGYSAIHDWVYRWKGKPIVCMKCDERNRIEWANKSHKYRRDLNDWIPLCYWCHRKYDGISKFSKKDIQEIRKRNKDGESQINLSKIYKVNVTTIHKIVNKQTWRFI